MAEIMYRRLRTWGWVLMLGVAPLVVILSFVLPFVLVVFFLQDENLLGLVGIGSIVGGVAFILGATIIAYSEVRREKLLENSEDETDSENIESKQRGKRWIGGVAGCVSSLILSIIIWPWLIGAGVSDAFICAPPIGLVAGILGSSRIQLQVQIDR